MRCIIAWPGARGRDRMAPLTVAARWQGYALGPVATRGSAKLRINIEESFVALVRLIKKAGPKRMAKSGQQKGGCMIL